MFLICFGTPTSCLLNLLQWHPKEKKRDSEALDKYDEGLKRRYSDNNENEEWDGSGPSNQEPEEYGYSKYCFLCSDATNVVHRFILKELEGTLEQYEMRICSIVLVHVGAIYARVTSEVVKQCFERPKEPYVGRCLLNTKITGDDAPGETWHMVFTTE
ncbi:hypothetical protein Tco_1020913, partial [Tanacetum coccineum]